MNKNKITEKEKNHFYRVIAFVEIIVALFLIINIIIVIGVCKNNGNDVSDKEFTNIGLYNYFENNFVDYNLLKNDVSSNADSMNNLNKKQKIAYVVDNYFKTGKTSMLGEEFENEFVKYFGQEGFVDATGIETYNENYSYDYNSKSIVKNEKAVIITNTEIELYKAEDFENVKKLYKVENISYKDDNYVVSFNIYKDDGRKISYLDVQNKNYKKQYEIQEKIGTAELTVKVQDGRYIIEDFVQEVR